MQHINTLVSQISKEKAGGHEHLDVLTDLKNIVVLFIQTMKVLTDALGSFNLPNTRPTITRFKPYRIY